jgi:hypothetical protein
MQHRGRSYYPKYFVWVLFFFTLGTHLLFLPFDNHRRANALTPAQEAALQQLVQFIDAHLLAASNEKRGVALHLIILLVQRVPADCLPIALTAVS